jgi:hypothetical protein
VGKQLFLQKSNYRFEERELYAQHGYGGKLNSEKKMAINGTGTSPTWNEVLQGFGHRREYYYF